MNWSVPLLVAAGSAVGGVLRLFTHEAMRHWLTSRPELAMLWGTLTVNLFGCLLAGAALAILQPTDLDRSAIGTWKALLIVGVLGGFTTFSAFSLETLTMVRDGHWMRAIVYVLTTTLGSIALAALAFVVVRKFVGAAA